MLWGPLYINSVHLRLARTQVLTSQSLGVKTNYNAKKAQDPLLQCPTVSDGILPRLHIDSAHIFLYATTVLAFLTDFKAQK